ncbi:angiopoietin-1 [Cherax quadricarinatus]|uniref:angiopoietin-1 n=1 Tax=Cherax quadricarinatus TaxID=27406 RepID=UPI00387E8E2E
MAGLLLLMVTVVCSVALPDSQTDKEEFDYRGHIVLNQIAIQHTQEQLKSFEQTLKTVLRKIEDLANVFTTKMALYEEHTQHMTEILTAHVTQCTEDTQVGEHKNNITQHLLREIQSLQLNVEQQEHLVNECQENVTRITNNSLPGTCSLPCACIFPGTCILPSMRIVTGACLHAQDCSDIQRQGVTQSGVYQIFPNNSGVGVRVLCEVQEGHMWTVLLVRQHQIPQEIFARKWQDYKNGFGNPHGEYWMGNDNLHALTGDGRSYRLRVVATNIRGEQRSAEWKTFSVGDEASGYQVTVNEYRRGSTLGDAITEHSMDGMKFTTVDREHDTNSGKW